MDYQTGDRGFIAVAISHFLPQYLPNTRIYFSIFGFKIQMSPKFGSRHEYTAIGSPSQNAL